MLLSLFLLSKSLVTVIIGRYKTKKIKEKQSKNKVKSTKSNQENKISFETSFKRMWHEIKAWSYLESNNF